MAKKKTIMTNAMRSLNAAKVPFEAIEYETDGTVGDHFGEAVAEKMGIPPEQSYKTLVGRGAKNGILVVCIPVCCEVDLKKLAIAAGEKKVELIAVKELLGLTGYIRGSVSPIGMKKKYPTYILLMLFYLLHFVVFLHFLCLLHFLFLLIYRYFLYYCYS